MHFFYLIKLLINKLFCNLENIASHFLSNYEYETTMFMFEETGSPPLVDNLVSS